MKLFGRILKYSCYVVMFAVIALLIGRIFISDYYPSAISSFYVSDTVKNGWVSNDATPVYRQNLRISYDEPRFAKFMAGNQYYCPSLGELQISLRYNNSTLEEVQKDFALPETPVASADLFDYSLVDENGRRYPLACYVEDRAFMYNYMRLVFSDVDFGPDVGWLRLEIYYKDAVDYDKDPYAMIAVWEREMTPYDELYTPSVVR